MFTGLIHSVGKVQRKACDLILVEGCESFSPLNLGDSISVDGVCLTAAELVDGGFVANVSEETFNRTNLGKKSDLKGFVNLEPALRLSDRLGGHLVSGHIDCIGEIVKIETLNGSWHIEISLEEKKFGRFLCEKASISVDGISLTVAGCMQNGSSFWIAVIPHTWSNTTLHYLQKGSLVNLEMDLMAKYAETLLAMKGDRHFSDNHDSQITKEWLQNHGWT